MKRNMARLRATPTSDAAENAETRQPGAYDNIEQRPLGERCIIAFSSSSGPPMLPTYFYNNMKQVVQTKDYVMILTEMVHDVRIIPFKNDARARQHPQVVRRLDRPLGGRYPRRRDDEFQRQDAVPRLVGEAEGDRAVQPRGRQDAPVSVYN